ncbi:hypothetical protein EVAR_31635_1 [Eumeta japonica]|uniref:Uncharacterized protein n=1 Tax=Eumeta variegata TaxID=151549 RepID=A0A4C1VZD5_EUMVA|nr:hypothetical protein EVAR_31635_1 [Eumeta japonica]
MLMANKRYCTSSLTPNRVIGLQFAAFPARARRRRSGAAERDSVKIHTRHGRDVWLTELDRSAGGRPLIRHDGNLDKVRGPIRFYDTARRSDTSPR